MILSYGSYTHDDNEVWITVSKDTIYNSFGEPRGHRARYIITGVKQGSSASDLTSKLTTLENAYGQDYRDLTLYDNNSNRTVHALSNSDTFGGVHVKSFQYLDGNPRVWGQATEYVNVRTFRIVVEGEVLARGGLLAYQETVMTIGGGPQDIWVPSAKGVPQRQRIRDYTTFKTVQVGQAVGDLTYPVPPQALWPQYIHHEKTQGKLYTPRFVPGGTTEYRVDWKYEFESASPLVGGPSLIVR